MVVQCCGGNLFAHRRLPKPRGGVFKLVGAEGVGAFDQFGLGVGLRVQGLGAEQHQGECGQAARECHLGRLGISISKSKSRTAAMSQGIKRCS